MKLSAALLLLVFTTTCFAQANDSNDEVVPPYPVPAGELSILELQNVKVTSKSQFTTYIEQNELRGNGSLLGLDQSSDVDCSLTAENISFESFKEIKRESVGGAQGARFYVSPTNSINLKFKTSLSSVEEVKPSCNGEPELCEGQSTYYQYRTQVILFDEHSNEWSLNCVAPFSRPVFASDVKINGIEVK